MSLGFEIHLHFNYLKKVFSVLLLFLENILEITDFSSGAVDSVLQFIVLMHLSSLLKGLLAQVSY